MEPAISLPRLEVTISLHGKRSEFARHTGILRSIRERALAVADTPATPGRCARSASDCSVLGVRAGFGNRFTGIPRARTALPQSQSTLLRHVSLPCHFVIGRADDRIGGRSIVGIPQVVNQAG